MPVNTPTGVIVAFFASVCGFAIIWYIWWLAIVGLVGAFAIFVWYAAMARVGLPALFIVQIAHALQYLIFPFRVEMNRTRRALGPGASQLVVFQIMIYLTVLLVGSIVASIVLPLGAMAVVTNWLGSRPGQVVGFAISAFFNIHHYFTDGVVWKLRDPGVRADLFGHLKA